MTYDSLMFAMKKMRAVMILRTIESQTCLIVSSKCLKQSALLLIKHLVNSYLQSCSVHMQGHLVKVLNLERKASTIEMHSTLMLELFDMTYFRQGCTAKFPFSFKVESKSNYCCHSFLTFAGQVLNCKCSGCLIYQEFYCTRL